MSKQDTQWGFKFLDTTLHAGHQHTPTLYLPGTTVQADNCQADNDGPCPSEPGDGLCVAKDCRGATSGGATLLGSVCVLVSYKPADVLGEDEHKVRVRRLKVSTIVLDVRALLITSRADLSRADLSGADLSRANLSGANLSGANLSRANLSRADLSRADLYGANLSGANLSGANLSRADLSRADLSRADLSGAENATLPAGWEINASGLAVRV